MDMSISRRPHRRWSGCHFTAAFTLGLALVVAGASSPGRLDGSVSAQELNPCALLLLDDDVKPVAGNTSVDAGVSSSVPSWGFATCRYMWGDGVDRFKLVVTVTEAPRLFPGMTLEQIKQQLIQSVRAGTHDEVVQEIGDAAVFKPDSFAYAIATAFVKGRILQVQLDGYEAIQKKDQVIGLLKSAASRL